MEETTIKLSQYNEEAIKLFVQQAIKESTNPVFVEIYITKDWISAYEVLKTFKTAIPLIVVSYNEAYNKIITINN